MRPLFPLLVAHCCQSLQCPEHGTRPGVGVIPNPAPTWDLCVRAHHPCGEGRYLEMLLRLRSTHTHSGEFTNDIHGGSELAYAVRESHLA